VPVKGTAGISDLGPRLLYVATGREVAARGSPVLLSLPRPPRSKYVSPGRRLLWICRGWGRCWCGYGCWERLGGGFRAPERRLRAVVFGVALRGGRVWLASPAVRAARRCGLGCRAAALGNQVGSAPGVGSGGGTAPGVYSVAWCWTVTGRGHSGDAEVLVCSTCLSLSPRHDLDEVLGHFRGK
jgi:hypothetical protein